MAEFLVHEFFPFKLVFAVVAYSQSILDTIKAVLLIPAQVKAATRRGYYI